MSSLIVEDRVAETTTTTGTGDITLAAAIAGFRRFSSVCSTGDTVYYTIEAVDGNGIPTGDWEDGLGTYSAANTLTRTTVLRSSNSNSAVSFSAGTKRVYISATQAYLQYLQHGIGLPGGQLNTTAAGSSGFYLGRRVFCERNMTINHVAFQTTSAAATSKYQPFIYDCTPPSTGGALIASGAQVTGSLSGYNKAPLSSPANLLEGNFYIIGCSVITADLANMFLFSTGFNGIFASNGGSSTIPSNPAPAFSTGGTFYGFWGVA